MTPSEHPSQKHSMSLIPVPPGYAIDLDRVRVFLAKVDDRLVVDSVHQRGNSLLIQTLHDDSIGQEELRRFGEIVALEMMTGTYNLPAHRRLLLVLRQRLRKLFS